VLILEPDDAHQYAEALTTPPAVQTVQEDRVALEIQHRSTLARLEESLQEKKNLQGMMLEQARVVSVSSLTSVVYSIDAPIA
jgi:hypothetical protein